MEGSGGGAWDEEIQEGIGLRLAVQNAFGPLFDYCALCRQLSQGPLRVMATCP